MKKLTFMKILINTFILGTMLLLGISAHGFEMTFKNEVGQDTRIWVYERLADGDGNLLHEVDITKGTSLMIDLAIEKPAVLAVFWLVKYEQHLSQPWLTFWIHENFINMTIHLVAGEFVPKEIVDITKGIIH